MNIWTLRFASLYSAREVRLLAPRGERLDRYEAAGGFFAPVLTADKATLLSWAEDFHFHAVSATDGSPKWKFNTGLTWRGLRQRTPVVLSPSNAVTYVAPPEDTPIFHDCECAK